MRNRTTEASQPVRPHAPVNIFAARWQLRWADVTVPVLDEHGDDVLADIVRRLNEDPDIENVPILTVEQAEAYVARYRDLKSRDPDHLTWLVHGGPYPSRGRDARNRRRGSR